MELVVTQIKGNATVYETVSLVKKVAKDKAYSLAIKNVLSKFPFQPSKDWLKTVFAHFNKELVYQFDQPGHEQIKTPDWFYLGAKRGDCDDFTTLWGALLTNVGIKWAPKIVSYSKGGDWAHIYPVCFPEPTKPDFIVLDNVLGVFDKEVQFYKSEVL